MPHCPDSSDFSSFDSSNKDASVFEDELFEQTDVFSYWNINVPYIDAQLCRGNAEWYNSEDLDEASFLLKLLKESGEPLTKLQLARLRYPSIFRMSSTKFTDAEGHPWDISRIIQKKYVEKVGRLLRSISDDINRRLDKLGNDSSQKAMLLRNISLAIQIDQDEVGRAFYVYHGPDFVQPPDVIEMYLSWTEMHQAKNGRLQRLASELKQITSEVKQGPDEFGVGQLDNEDLPGIDKLQNDDFIIES